MSRLASAPIQREPLSHSTREKIAQKQTVETAPTPISADRDLSALSRQVQKVSEQVAYEARPQLSSKFIETDPDGNAITLTNGVINGVVHGLGRKYRGWSLAGVTGPGNIWELTTAEISTAGIDTTVYLPLRFENGSGTTVTVKLIVW